MILEQRGFVVETTREATTMRARMESDGYDLLVVCHTVPESEQRQIANAETRAQYLLQVPVMLLPTEFLNKVHQLVNRP
jgi:DNA-binding response OmpR family regulator